MQESKACKKCGVCKPATTEYFHTKKGNRDNLRHECRECRLKQQKLYYQNNKKEIIKKNNQYRKDNWETFTKRRKAYDEKNKEVLSEKRKEYNKKNKDIIAKKKKAYVAKHKEKYAAYYRKWARQNADKCKAKRHKRDAMSKNLACTLTPEQWQGILEKFDYSCAYCGTKENIHQEHFIPLSKGGGYTAQNIIPACHSCNSSKQNFDFKDWYKKQDNYSKKRETFILTHLA